MTKKEKLEFRENLKGLHFICITKNFKFSIGKGSLLPGVKYTLIASDLITKVNQIYNCHNLRNAKSISQSIFDNNKLY